MIYYTTNIEVPIRLDERTTYHVRPLTVEKKLQRQALWKQLEPADDTVANDLLNQMLRLSVVRAAPAEAMEFDSYLTLEGKWRLLAQIREETEMEDDAKKNSNFPSSPEPEPASCAGTASVKESASILPMSSPPCTSTVSVAEGQTPIAHSVTATV